MIIQDAKDLTQGTPEWRAARLGYASASRLDDVMATTKTGAESATRKNYRIQLALERLTNTAEESFSNAAMQWGIEQEPFARIEYEMHSGNLVSQTGFWKHPEIEWFGCSPDGLIDENGLIEIKCPNSATHVDYLLAGKVPAKYESQVQGQLWVMGREWSDFVSYDPRMPEKKRLFVVRAYRNDKYINEMEAQLKKFLEEVNELVNQLGE